ncbi:MAG: heme o synthase [Gammaproteobacteria bacterium]|jgi:protoheme IX farnesyltransferase|uniref:Protoheme IX farnesyltransferase n=1 Tax=SAR86 cluster bacterium TaxID=2030880 RepID=A0A520MU88_9GAMM|nr:protoheme IX farnesyltransferase [Gammaproteobacteria bacterium]RZO24777.1 MAG: protoheme IX farnesyltransferase [SAR86 cluster bacterium]|tara:strand:+ start:1389 stop:2255 length:867 start_codon:yes stop_codon:yes gene_type:complete
MGISSFIDLCKPKIVLLLTITALVGMLLTVEFYSNVLSSLASLLGFALLAASSAALNQIFDRESDKNMERTKKRPLATGELTLFQALSFTAMLLFIGSSLLLYFSNLLTLFITTLGFIFYSLIYTIYLKWATPQNIVIGGLSGALPPLIGWTAVTNEISLLPLILVLVIFLWTPPHFWPLAIDRLEEYKKEGVPMMPIAKGVTRTKKEMVVYAFLLLGASLAPFFYGLTGYFYLFSTTALNIYFIYLCIAYLGDEKNELSMKIFNFSVKYMFLFFLATYIDFLLMLYV